MIGPMTSMALINAGFQLKGAYDDSKIIDRQARVDKMVTETNAEVQKRKLSEDYTDVFAKNLSDLGTQISVFANAGTDKSSTLFTAGVKEHIKNFEENRRNYEDDMKNIDRGVTIANVQSKMTTIANKNKIYTNATMGIANSFMDWKKYNMDQEAKEVEISNRGKRK